MLGDSFSTRVFLYGMAADTQGAVPVEVLKGVGPKAVERLERLGIRSVQDLLFHFPVRYQDRTRVAPIGSLRPGDQAVIQGEVEHAEVRLGRRRSLLVRIADGTGAIILRFFHFSAAQKAGLERGTRLRCFGEVRMGPNSYELVHPEYNRLGEAEAPPAETALTPIYPTTEGMHQLTWRDLTEQALALLAAGRAGLSELLPAELLRARHMPPLEDAVRLLHRPPPDVSLELLGDGRHPAQRRLAFEELLAHQVSLRQLRHQHRRPGARALRGDGRLRAALRAALPFRLTRAQERVLAEVERDIADARPMSRLVQGDVGSGKTVVAALAALQAVEAGCQVAVMAPTELLAEQHFRNFENWMTPLGIEVAWVTGRLKGKAREAVLAGLAEGRAAIAVGTHALFQGDVAFGDLGLVIVDEQHRFGVHQRLALREKGRFGSLIPHQLIMTATPIPRSLAMTAYADLDLSVIDELPPGRTPVTTVVISDARRDEVVARVDGACAEGRQVYWVCTLVEESEALQCQAAEDTAAVLAEALPARRVGLVHGRVKADDKERVMSAFKAGDLDLLVATTVIEVGVDVPNASLMIIENPERLGLAQLHQLRGRVGRGEAASHCVLMYHPPLGQQARERLAVLRETTDGFAIAQKDLELRGPGEVLGTRQTGDLQFRVADLLRDQDMVADVQAEADRLVAEHPRVADALVRRWVGDKGHYADV
jgi:ATP-dependent DNA helicase RecG